MANSNWELGKFDRRVKKTTGARLEAVGMFVESSAKLRCVVDTGNLRNSITHKVNGAESVIIGTNVEYAPFIELGTERMSAQPFLQPAVLENKQTIMKILDLQN